MKLKIKILFSNIVIFLLFSTSFTNAAFNGKYTFQLESATKATIVSISAPQQGMMIYNTTDNEINYYDGTAWIILSAEGIYDANNQLTGDRVVDFNSNTLGFLNGNVGIGDETPDATLDVAGSIRLDGAYLDKDGDVGIISQVLTSTGVGTDWTSSVAAPNITNDIVSVSASSTTTVIFTGSNFIPTSIVTIPGFNGTINSTNVVSPTEIQVSITTGSAATFDIVVSNNGILNTQWTGNGVNLLEVN